MWGAGAVFQLTEYEDSHRAKVILIKEWKELVTQVMHNVSVNVITANTMRLAVQVTEDPDMTNET